MNLILFLLIGLFMGWVAGHLSSNEKSLGFFGNLIVGVIGAFAGGMTLNLLSPSLGLFASIIMAAFGSIFLIWILSAFDTK